MVLGGFINERNGKKLKTVTFTTHRTEDDNGNGKRLITTEC